MIIPGSIWGNAAGFQYKLPRECDPGFLDNVTIATFAH